MLLRSLFVFVASSGAVLVAVGAGHRRCCWPRKACFLKARAGTSR